MAIKPIRVSQLNSYIKRVLQADPILGNICVIGEISNLKYHKTGIYFSLKDVNSKISCYISPDVSKKLRYQLEEGMEITVYGYINLYEYGGTYSINIKDIEIQGAGNLAIAFEKLKTKLSDEGLFDPAYKKELPVFPKKVAVITSPTGAAVQDIKKIITEKNDYVDILIYPVLVQGPFAAADIASGINAVNQLFPETDVMIVGRGGGSAEELWAFNEEPVARAIFQSNIPVISAVGHETDFTIADFVADKRAETPTAAANMAVPDTRQLRQSLEDYRSHLLVGLQKTINYKTALLEAMGKDTMHRHLNDKISLYLLKCDSMIESLKNSLNQNISQKEQLLQEYFNVLTSLNPKEIMSRGYAALTDKSGRLITSTEKLCLDDEIKAVLKDGTITSKIIDIRRENI